MSTLVLLQAIRARCNVPMIAAGGICDGGGMTTAFALGAEGIQIDTRFVSCAESPVHANYKNTIVEAKETGSLVLNKKSSTCIRAIKSQRTLAIYEEGVRSFEAMRGIQDLYFGDDLEAAPALAGQIAGLIHSIKTAQQIIHDTVAELLRLRSGWENRAGARVWMMFFGGFLHART